MGKKETQIMNRVTKMLILAAVLAVVLIGYSAISRLVAEDSSNGVVGSEVSVFSMDVSAVTQLAWEYKDEEIVLEKVGGAWQYSGDSAFPLSSSKVSAMFSAISKVTASRAIEDVDTLVEYGLDKPGYKIRISNADGLLVTFYIGDKNEITGDYYLITDSSQTVYMVDDGLPSAFGNTLMDIVERESIPDISSAEMLMISTPENTNKIVFMSTHKGITYTSAYKWFYEFDVEGNIAYAPVGTQKASNLQSKITGIVWEDCVEYNVTESELKSYGLDNPRVEITAQMKNGDFTLMLGDSVEDSCYARIGNSGIVYLISADTVDAFTEVNFESLRPDDVCLMEWNTVDSMEITVDGRTRTIIFDRSKDGAEMSIIVDGYPGDTEAVGNLLGSINDMASIDQTDKTSPFSDPEVRVVFHRNTEYFHTMVLSLYRYNSQSYQVEFDGQSRLLVGNDDVAALKEAFEALYE